MGITLSKYKVWGKTVRDNEHGSLNFRRQCRPNLSIVSEGELTRTKNNKTRKVYGNRDGESDQRVAYTESEPGTECVETAQHNKETRQAPL